MTLNHPSWQRLFLPLLAIFLFALPSVAWAQETIPPKPPRYFNDYAWVVSATAADEFNATLEQFERDTSNQVVVAVFPKMLSNSDIADYTFRVKEAWQVGQRGKNNGVALFVFVQDRKLYIQVGYGLEGALPDATCKDIIDNAITPRFKANDYEGGLRAGIAAILAATKGEYKGTGWTIHALGPVPCIVFCIILFLLLGVFLFAVHYFGGTFYENHVRTFTTAENLYIDVWQMLFRVLIDILLSALSRSGSSGGGGGGFSGGGGSGGGGGAGGSW